MDEADLKDIIALIRSPVTTELIAYVSEQAAFVISCNQSSNCSTTRTTEEKYSVLPSLPAFIEHLVKRSASKAGTLLGSLVFLNKLQERLYNIAKGMPCTSHRIFLATLIVTTKSLHDTSPKNKHWAKYASYFNLPEINLMEKQLLTLMNYNIIITPSDINRVYNGFKNYLIQKQSSLDKPVASMCRDSSIMMQKLPMLNNCTLQNNSSLTDCNRLPTKPTPALTLSTKLNDFDLPTYATTVYPNLPDSTFSDSTLSLSSNISSDSSVLTLDDSMTTQEYYQGNASIAKFSQVHYKPNPKKENICTDSNDYNYTFQPENESYLFPLPPVHN